MKDDNARYTMPAYKRPTDILLGSFRFREQHPQEMAPTGQNIERRIVLRTRVADGYDLTELELKRLQRVFTDWFPGAVFDDLTLDTVRLDVVVKKGRLSGRSVYNTSFVNADGSVVKKADYDEDRITGKVCANYDPRRSAYFGKKDGFDYRNVFYTIRPTTRPRR